MTPVPPNDFLAAITGASGGLVAIVGGLLVARFLAIDSEQKGAAKRLELAKEELETADKRLAEIQDRLAREEVEYLFGTDDILGEIQEILLDENRQFPRHFDLNEERRLGPTLYSTDDALSPHLDRAIEAVVNAQELISAKLPHPLERARWWWNSETDWEVFRALDLSMSIPEFPQLWELTYHCLIWKRALESQPLTPQEREELDMLEEKLTITADDIQLLMQDTIPPDLVGEAVATRDILRYLNGNERGRRYLELRQQESADSRSMPHAPLAKVRRDPGVAEAARTRREELRRDLEQAEKVVTDAADRRERAFGETLTHIRPDRLLYVGLVVLAYQTAAGVIAPVYVLSTGTGQFTDGIRSLFWWFTGGLAALVAYLLWLLKQTLRSRREVEKNA